ncbi:glucose/ribitol short chain dehydrogenase/reductase family protein [Chondrocystis sp. NIES-4102]|nr:glucose/ribitol short chain dehydrogenase/reductase family protein [Chondrocystis sp. NIES-4102]
MKTVIITGGNSGLGYFCTQEIAKNKDWYIIIACRNLEKANQAVEKLQATTNSKQITAMELDLASLAAIRSFVLEFTRRDLPPLGAIVCNAGVQFVQQQTYTQDGYDTTFGVNHLGHFLLVNLLLPQLITPSRIIFVSSDTHDASKITGMPAPYFRDPQLMAYPTQDPNLQDKKIGEVGRIAYTTSKLCNVLCAYEFSRRFEAKNIKGIDVNVFNPGLMPGSGLAQDYTVTAKFVWNYILPIFSNFIPKINRMSNAGKALAKLVLDPTLDSVTGKYFSGFEMINSADESYDPIKAQQLWNGSLELVKLKPEEIRL